MPVRTRGKKPPLSLSVALWSAAALVFLFLVLKNSALAASLTFSSLTLCGKTLIPALFPAAVASRVLAESGALYPIATIFNRTSRRIFGIGGEAFATAVTGVVCGFPTGAVGAMTLYAKGRISKDELFRTVTLSGTPSLSFLVFAVGEKTFNNRNFGFFLFFASVFSSAAVTSLYAFLGRKKRISSPENKKDPPLLSESDPFGVKEFTSAVSSSALDIIRVSAYVIFFSVAAGLAENALPHLPAISPLLGSLEITGGMIRAAALAHGGKTVAAFLAGFGGLSAAAQVGSIAADGDIPMGKYLLCRLFAGSLSALAVTLWAWLSI